MLCRMTFFDFFLLPLYGLPGSREKNKKAQFSFYRFSLNFLHCTAPGGGCGHAGHAALSLFFTFFVFGT